MRFCGQCHCGGAHLEFNDGQIQIKLLKECFDGLNTHDGV